MSFDQQRTSRARKIPKQPLIIKTHSQDRQSVCLSVCLSVYNFDCLIPLQLEVELAVGNITNKVRLARIQRELLGLYQQLSVLE